MAVGVSNYYAEADVAGRGNMNLIVGDLWQQDGYKVIPTNLSLKQNGEAVMGKGVAAQAVKRHPTLPYRYGRFLQDWNQPDLYLVHDWQLICLPVKRGWALKAEYDIIEQGLLALRQELLLRPRSITPLFLPLLGCGFGELDETRVRSLLDIYFHEEPGVTLVLRDAETTQRQAATLMPGTRQDRSTMS